VVNATPRPLYPRERDPVPIVQKVRYNVIIIIIIVTITIIIVIMIIIEVVWDITLCKLLNSS